MPTQYVGREDAKYLKSSSTAVRWVMSFLCTPFATRRQKFESIAQSFRDSIHLAPMTTDQRQPKDCFHTFQGVDLDGLIAKLLDGAVT